MGTLGTFSTPELKGWFFLLVSLAFLVTICALAALATYMQPCRWSERPRMLATKG